ncbi:MAG: hypothetical protein QM758_01190 [Armatimonas sp.]
MTRRWLMMLIKPADLLVLLKERSRPGESLPSPHLPPDVKIEDAYYDEARESFVLVLASDWFEPVSVSKSRDGWRGSWNELIVEVADSITPAPSSLQSTDFDAIPPPPEARWEAYFLRPADVLKLLGSEGDAPPLPPDVRLRGAHYDPDRGALVLFLESGFFAPAPQLRDAEGVRITLPERWWGTADARS